MNDLTTKDFWSDLKRKSSRIDKHEFDEIFEEHLKQTKGTALEVGCVPGNILARICKRFGYFPEGIDFDEHTVSTTGKTLLDSGLKHFKIYVEDFNKWKTNKKYDLVCSFGFVEHFSNAEEIIKKHIDLVKKGGKVIIEVPNFAGVPGFFHKLVDGPSLKQHNTSIMNLDFFRDIAKQNNLKVLYLGYYGSFHFQWGYGRRETANLVQKGIYALLKLISKLTIHIKMRNKMSNYIFFIAEK